LLGFTWTFLYALMFQLHLESFGGLAVAQPGHPTELQHIFPILGYFSLTTLSTIGFGDITPLTLQARFSGECRGSQTGWRSEGDFNCQSPAFERRPSAH
jgi:hypothetical protein